MQYLARVIKQHEEKRKGERLYTTAEAAKRAGVSRQTLQTWMAVGKSKGPDLSRPGHIRLGGEEDIAQLRKVGKRPGRPRREDAGKKMAHSRGLSYWLR